MHRTQVPGGAADPVGERGAIEIDALPGADLRLAIERQVVGIFGDQNLGDRRLGRQAALDQPRGRGSLHDNVLAGAAGVFGPAHDDHAQLRRHDVQPLAHVLADPVQVVAAAGAGVILDVDDHLDAGKVRRQRAPVGPALGRARLTFGRSSLLLLFLAGRLDLFGFFQAKQ